MSSVASDKEETEYNELIDMPEIINNEGNNTETNELVQEVDLGTEMEYIESSELDESHTIIVHEGRQYVIPTSELQESGNTIVLEDDGDEEQMQTNEDAVYYEINDEATTSTGLGRQYAILKNGKLHIQDTVEATSSKDNEIQQKLRDLEHSLNNYDDPNAEYTEMQQEQETNIEQADEEDETISQITGKNLITGQTISLSTFLEKLRRRGMNDKEPIRRSYTQKFPTQSNEDYILIPPLKRRIVLGKLENGRRLVANVLQIQKKITTTNYQKRPYQRRQQPLPVKRPLPPPPPVPKLPSKFSYSALLDENVSRTMAGLMDLESVEKSLAGRKIIVRHVQKRSREGRQIVGTRRVAFYKGKMARTPPDSWQFIAEVPVQRHENSFGIDIPEDDNQHQVQLNVDENGVIFNSTEDDNTMSDQITSFPMFSDDEEDEEPIIVFLTVTQDEFGKKKTKVTIPQLASGKTTKPRNDDYTNFGKGFDCNLCGKHLANMVSYRKHVALHATPVETIHKNSSITAKSYKCGKCHQQFRRHSNLLRHLEIHQQSANKTDVTEDAENTNSKKFYSCNICGCQYKYVSSLTRHIVTNHMTSTQIAAESETQE